MNQADLYDNIVASIIKLSTDFIAAEIPSASYVDWDAHSTLIELPPGTLIGPAGCGMTHDERAIEVVFAVGVGVQDDPNLFALRRLVSKLYGCLVPETRITIYDHATAQAVSWMVVKTPVAVTPVNRAMTRAMQFVECRAVIDLSATSSR